MLTGPCLSRSYSWKLGLLKSQNERRGQRGGRGASKTGQRPSAWGGRCMAHTPPNRAWSQGAPLREGRCYLEVRPPLSLAREAAKCSSKESGLRPGAGPTGQGIDPSCSHRAAQPPGQRPLGLPAAPPCQLPAPKPLRGPEHTCVHHELGRRSRGRGADGLGEKLGARCWEAPLKPQVQASRTWMPPRESSILPKRGWGGAGGRTLP